MNIINFQGKKRFLTLGSINSRIIYYSNRQNKCFLQSNLEAPSLSELTLRKIITGINSLKLENLHMRNNLLLNSFVQFSMNYNNTILIGMQDTYLYNY